MFTGLIEHIATLTSRIPKDTDGGFTLTFSSASPILEDCHVGDSIAVNGACLTVTEFDADSFKVGLAPETLERTNLGDLVVGDRVNCERALAAHTRFGGHFVQGHVDTTATILSLFPDSNSLRLTFQLPSSTPLTLSLLPSLIPKGYVTIDGASLTLTNVDDKAQTFSIMLIAHSQEKLVLSSKKVGDKVNVEVDSVGKFVEKAVRRGMEEIMVGGGNGGALEGMVERVVERVLREKGVLPK
ncbi:riboflavin synthase [Mrakia frigida]|uniref:riboflavin synthase n=1 Tax=Mrakia frigida TaxID=29902 RepID=UPI003FCC092C